MTPGSGRSLTRIIALRASAAALVVSAGVVVFLLVAYLSDTNALRRATLEYEKEAILADLRAGKDPALRPNYRAHPEAYAFIVSYKRLLGERQIVASANADLISEPGAAPAVSAGDELLGPTGAITARASPDRWDLTDRENIGGRWAWVRITINGDPAGLWWRVIANEILNNALLPMLGIVPALTVMMVLTTRLALRPLERIARQATELGAAAGQGGTLAPLDRNNMSVEFVQVADSINAMLARLEHTLTLQRQFSADAAHELRTPLAILRMQLEELPEGRARDTMRGTIDDLGGLVSQLLQFAQAEDAALARRVPVDVAAAARRVCMDLAPMAVARRKVLAFDGPEGPSTVPGHAPLVETAIRNVVDNALKYAPEGTVVTIRVDAWGAVAVEDEGGGIPEAARGRLFGRFWRGDGKREGVGIGLALVRRIAELHGGSVAVEDREGGGARFLLRFTGAA